MRLSRLFSEYLFGWIRFMKIKNDPELAARSKRFGKMSIGLSIFSVLMSVATILLSVATGNAKALLSVVAVIVAILNLMPLTGALAQMTYQFRLNKLSIRWVALVFVCIAFVACVLSFVITFATMGK